jgi:hypothetical protein
VNTVRLPVASLSAQGIAPTLHAAEGNRVDLPVALAVVGGVVPSVEAGQVKLTYKGRLGIKTTFRSSLGQ